MPAKKAIPAIGPATAPAIHAWLGGEESGFPSDGSSVGLSSVDVGLALVGSSSVGFAVSLVVDVVEAGDAGCGFDFVDDSSGSMDN